MNFIKIEQRNIDRSPPTGWKKTWYGYFQMVLIHLLVKQYYLLMES